MRTVIDCDPLVHIIANVQWSVGNEGNEKVVREHTRSFLSNILATINPDEYLLFVQDMDAKNFRKTILPEYKAHRVTSPAIEKWKPVIVDELKILGVYGLMEIESDDALGIIANKYHFDVLVVENDKDLKQIPGNHYNPFKKDPNGSFERFYSYSVGESIYNIALQTITGDPTDMPGSLCGIEKIGPKTAEKILDSVKQIDYISTIATEYVKKYGVANGLRRMALTYELVKILVEPTEKYPESITVANLPWRQYKQEKVNFVSGEIEEDNIFQ